MSIVERVRGLFYDRRIVFNNEKELQDEVAAILDAEGIQYAREFRAGGLRSILDFLLIESRTAIEIKVKGATESDILRQLKRYADLSTINEIILISPRPFNMPATLSGKPVHVIAIFASMI